MLRFCFGFLGDLFLVLILIENNRSILRSVVGSLRIQRSWIMGGPENFQDFIVADDRWIESNLDDFRVARRASADFLVGRVGDGTAGVTGNDGFYAVDALEDGFRTPKAAAAEGGVL